MMMMMMMMMMNTQIFLELHIPHLSHSIKKVTYPIWFTTHTGA